MPVLDTNFLIAAHSNDAAAVELLHRIRGERIVVPPWVVVEFLTGHTQPPEVVYPFLDRAYDLWQTTPDWVRSAAVLRRRLHQEGARIRLPDFWIASVAEHLEMAVVTKDAQHFRQFGVDMLSW